MNCEKTQLFLNTLYIMFRAKHFLSWPTGSFKIWKLVPSTANILKRKYQGGEKKNFVMGLGKSLQQGVGQGRNWVILRGGRRYICNMKDGIIHGLCRTVKCRDKVWNAGGGARPAPTTLLQLRPCPVAIHKGVQMSMTVGLSTNIVLNGEQTSPHGELRRTNFSNFVILFANTHQANNSKMTAHIMNNRNMEV